MTTSIEGAIAYRKEWLESGISDERVAATEAMFLDELLGMDGKAKRMLDRLIGKIEDMEWDCDAEVYDALFKIQHAMA